MVEGAVLLGLMAAVEDDGDTELYTAEGDPVAPAASCFTVVDRAALLAALRGAADFEPADADPGTAQTALTWIDEASPTRYAIGHVTVEHDMLRVEAFSPQRAERARLRLVELAGSYVTFGRVELLAAHRELTSHEERS